MRAQRLVLWIGLGLAIASILYPPWARVSSRAEMFLGYAWIFDPPEYSVIALSHLAIQTALLGAALGMAYLLSAGVEIRSSNVQRTATLGLKILASFVVIAISLVPTTFFTTSRGPSGAWLVSTVILFGGLYAIWRTRKTPAGTPSKLADLDPAAETNARDARIREYSRDEPPRETGSKSETRDVLLLFVLLLASLLLLFALAP